MIRDTKKLPCVLTDRELNERRDRLASLIDEIVTVEARKKAEATLAKEQLDELGSAARKTAREIRERAEYRQVDVVERHDPIRFCVDVFRDDTGEIVQTRAMTEDEIAHAKQLMLPTIDPAERRRRKKAGEQPEDAEGSSKA